MMHKVYRLAFLALLLPSAPAWAEWTGVSQNDEFVVYVDLATIRSQGNGTKMWSLYDYKTPQHWSRSKWTYLSEMSQYEFDCTQETITTLYTSLHSGHMRGGKILFTDSIPELASPLPPGSIGEALWKIACGKQ